MEELLVVAENDKGRRFDAGLGHVVDLQAFSLIGRRLNARGSVAENVVEHTRWNAHSGLVVDIVDKLEQAVDALSGLGGNEHNWRIGHIRKSRVHILAELVHGLGVFFYQIPLIDDNDAGFAAFVRNAGNAFILGGHALGRVDKN